MFVVDVLSLSPLFGFVHSLAVFISLQKGQKSGPTTEDGT